MAPDELDNYDQDVDRDEAVVSELDDERGLSDADELADVDAERDSSHFDETRSAYSGVVDGDDDVDVRELESAGALLDDPDPDDDTDDDA